MRLNSAWELESCANNFAVTSRRGLLQRGMKVSANSTVISLAVAREKEHGDSRTDPRRIAEQSFERGSRVTELRVADYRHYRLMSPTVSLASGYIGPHL